MELIQTNSTTTTLNATLYAADGVTVVGGTWTATDTTTALQNVQGTAALFYYNHGLTATSPAATEIQFYNGDPAATGLAISGATTAYTAAAISGYTVASNGTLSGNVVVTPNDNGAGGVFSPSSITLTPTVLTGYFKYTAPAAGTVNISLTNNGSLANPSPYTVTVPSTTLVQVSSAAWKFSPANWRGDTGRGGDAWRQAWCNGAWCEVDWVGSSSPTAILYLPISSTAQLINYQINGVFYYQVIASDSIQLTNLVANGPNKLKVWLDSSPQIARWSPETNVTRVGGLVIDSASTAGTAPAANPWILVHHNSIGEGIGAETQSNNHSFVMSIQRAMDAIGIDVCQDGCGYSGYLSPGDSTSDVPPLYLVTSGLYSEAGSRWDKISNGVSRLDSNGHISAYGSTGQDPVAIFVIMSVNEDLHSKSLTDTRASVAGYIAAARAAAPNAVLSICLDFGHECLTGTLYHQTYLTAIEGGFADYQAANPADKHVVFHSAGVTLALSLIHI